ncbi:MULTISPECIES: hypothetical protein [unclassified Inquilinus]|uniref:hypothetical protein n=1 Tax=unclassified Inquilinus TaxID=2645927 RepID=UPI003F92936D
MNEDSERFNKGIVDTIARRAGNICSNPDCGALTSGPAEDEKRAINVGEAAHIYGARQGSARFNSLMSDSERSDITNAIWLCRNCHKIVDADSQQFPVSLLFEWRRAHEYSVMENLGKSGALLRLKVLERKLEEFPNLSSLGRQIIIDKPDIWEYKLSAELMRSMLEPIVARWGFLQRGAYFISGRIFVREDYMRWHVAHIYELGAQIGAISQIINGEIQTSWGTTGKSGSEVAIYRACSLLKDVCQRLLEWEEAIRFCSVPEEFKEVRDLLIGVGGKVINKIYEIPLWLKEIISDEKSSSMHHFVLDIDFPEQLNEEMQGALDRMVEKFQ